MEFPPIDHSKFTPPATPNSDGNYILNIEVTDENADFIEYHRQWLIEHGYGDPVIVEGKGI